ncbi:MAG: hypothetical protein GY810_28020 [Aureispira sp.]|nr:hypothetical protein [Aureispira sp.]
MDNNLLDHFESDNTDRIEPPNYRVIVGIAWLLFGIWLIYDAISIFRWNYIIYVEFPDAFSLISRHIPHIACSYQYSFQVIFSFGLAYFILFNTQYRREYLLAFIGNYIIFHITALGTFIFPDNLFTINILLCITLLFTSFFKYKESLFPLNLSTLKKRYYVLMFLGLLPTILARTIDYKIFYFLK